jgi:hypothetical protein
MGKKLAWGNNSSDSGVLKLYHIKPPSKKD